MPSKLQLARKIYEKHGTDALLRSGRKFVSNSLVSVIDPLITSRRGEYLFENEWELAIILDACRYDLGYEGSQDHQLSLGNPEKVYSVGSTSVDWIARTFSNAYSDQIANTAYISANPFTNHVPHNQINYLERVYRYAWDKKLGTVPPRPVTDRTISLMRDDVADRYIAHYMQPHLPSLTPVKQYDYRVEPTEGMTGAVTDLTLTPWDQARAGKEQKRIIQNYRNNLKPVLDDIELLIDNVNASRVVITADHGNYLGEKGRWGHPSGHIHPAVRHVPWWEIEANDNQTYTPNRYTRSTGDHRENKLQALGYR